MLFVLICWQSIALVGQADMAVMKLIAAVTDQTASDASADSAARAVDNVFSLNSPQRSRQARFNKKKEVGLRDV